MLGHYEKIVGICMQKVCKMSYVPLNAKNCMQNVQVKKNQNFILAVFFHLDEKKCLYRLNSSVL